MKYILTDTNPVILIPPASKQTLVDQLLDIPEEKHSAWETQSNFEAIDRIIQRAQDSYYIEYKFENNHVKLVRRSYLLLNKIS